MADAFDRFQGTDSAKGDAFDRFPVEEESFGKSAARTALQIPQGFAEVTPPGLAASFFQLLAAGETDLPVEEWQRLRKLGEESGIPWDDEAYESARQEVLGSIPTVSNIARKVEETTGIPLEPKTKLQKGVRFGTSAAKILPKSTPIAFRGTDVSLPRPILGAGIAGAKEGLTALGVPEPIADIASFAVVKPAGAGSAKFDIGAAKKESGLTTRRYEKLKDTREVSPAKLDQINKSVEKEFREIADKILKDSPVAGTKEALSNDVTFKQKVQEGFQEVRDLADSIPVKFPTKDIKDPLTNLANKSTTKGLTPGEFEKEKARFLNEYVKDTKGKDFTASDLVDQYRINNKQLTEAFTPGQSFAYNRAKRESLLDYNKVIAEAIESKFPGSNFSNLFKETNQKWTEISNLETVQNFMDDLFEGKINYKKGRQLFDKNGATIPFKKAMGEEGFAKFETLLNDLMSTEKANGLLKAAEKQGYTDLAKTGLTYLVHPKLGGAKLAYDTIKGSYKAVANALLDKPQISITWDRGINAAKAGNFKVAEKEFNSVKQQIEKNEATRVEALKKFNEKKKANQKTTK